MEKILLIDPDGKFLNDVESALNNRFVTLSASTGEAGLEIARRERPTVVLLNHVLPDIEGMGLLGSLFGEVDPHLPVIIVSDNPDTERVTELMHHGAYDSVSKEVNPDILHAKIVKALERRRLEISVRALQSAYAEHHDRLVFASQAMKSVHYEMSRLAALPFDILITGETGVGKDLCAFEIHQRSNRRENPFIPVAMRSLSESLIESELFGHEKGAFSGAERTKIGKLEAAQGGTLYIPEISSLTEFVQLKLLQFMQYKSVSRVGQDPRRPETRVDVRIIMATNESLEPQVRNGSMREDFYHRVSGITLNLIPLRERKADIEPLARYFLKKYAPFVDHQEYELAPELLEAMLAYRWPGNARELENAVKRALAHATGRVLTLDDLPMLRSTSAEESVCRVCLGKRSEVLPKYRVAERQFKLAYAEEVVHRNDRNISKAAIAAGISAQGLRKILNGNGKNRTKEDTKDR